MKLLKKLGDFVLGKKNPDAADIVPAEVIVLYTTSSDAHEWCEWNVALSREEEHIYRKAIKKKALLEDVLELGSVLDRAEHEIIKHENLDYPPRMILKDPNYPAEAPDARAAFLYEEHFGEVAKLMRKFEERETDSVKEIE